MAELLAAFPKHETSPSFKALIDAGRFIESYGLGNNARLCNAGGAGVLTTSSSAHRPAVYIAPDERGWIAIKGIIFDTRADDPFVDLENLWRGFEAGDRIDWNRFEGAYALAAWNARTRKGLALTDQTASMNLYYCEDEAYFYCTTTALPLARSLSRYLAPSTVREFLTRGELVAPSSLFEGFSRFNIGEHATYENGSMRVRRHWWFPERQESWSFQRAAEEAAQMCSDRIRRYSAVTSRNVILDLTSGYDSRLLAAAADHAGIKPSVTVNGPDDDEDVVIAIRVARAADWPMYHFSPDKVWNNVIDPSTRRLLACRADGNLPFTEVYHQQITRPLLAEEFDLHVSGIGGEFIRYHPWGQEFFGVGRRRPANTDNIIKYRILHDRPPPTMFPCDLYSIFRAEMKNRVEAVCMSMPGTLTTQQLDAVYAWKQTGHSSLYTSAVFNWLPTAVPSMGAGFITVGMVTPWRFRLTARLTRRVTYLLCPRAASVVTRYGGTAGPVRISNLHRHVWQPLKRFGHLAAKVDRVVLGGRVIGRFLRTCPQPRVPYLTDEFHSFLEPESMYTRFLYTDEGLRCVGVEIEAYEKFLLRIATLEHLCRELDFKPDAGFLSQPSEEPDGP